MCCSSCDSVESFPGSRNTSRTAERDWDNGSTASSITSMAEYTGQCTETLSKMNGLQQGFSK